MGGWLVLERWIAPDVFHDTDATDEYSLCVQLGPKQVFERLAKHRDGFITEQTIKQIAALGLNTVRLPVGYWLFGGVEPYVDGASRYVDQLFIWAQKHNVGVILDVHAVPGSQNGWDHSGRAGEIGWHKDPYNVEVTLQFLAKLCERYGSQRQLTGIEVLNEPHWDVPLAALMDYYERAYCIIREKCPVTVGVIFSDSFRPGEVSRQLAHFGGENIAMDMHLYQLFTSDDRALDMPGHSQKTTQQWPEMIREAASRLPIMIGEWSAAMSESHHTYDSEDYQKYARTQIKTFESGGVGWVYWTARVHDGGAWSLLDHPEFLLN